MPEEEYRKIAADFLAPFAEWRTHTDRELEKLRQNQHDLRNTLNVISLQQVNAISDVKEKISALELSTTKELEKLRVELVDKFGVFSSAMTISATETKDKLQDIMSRTSKRDGVVGVWATVGSTIVAAIPAICVLVWWLVARR